jgi:hypothetical protein
LKFNPGAALDVLFFRAAIRIHPHSKIVILSEVIVSRSEAITQSKDPNPASQYHNCRKAFFPEVGGRAAVPGRRL